MSKRVVAETRQYLTPADVNRLGEFAQDALDEVVGGVIGYPAHWAAFTVSIKAGSNQVITVSPGRYFEGEAVYASPAIERNLVQYFPLNPADEKWLALYLRGEDKEIHEPRQFETSMDPEVRVPVQDQRPVVMERFADIRVQQGEVGPAPAAKPTIPDGNACIAFVRVTTLGIQEIVPGVEWRAKTLAEVEGRVTAIEIRVARLFEDTETIRTDVANIAAQLGNIPDPRLFEQVVRDTARLSQYANLPEEARNYWFDQALVKDEWDFTQGGYFRIDEGVRFQFVAQRDHTLRVLDLAQNGISFWENRRLMPAYTEVTRITSPEGTGRKDISNTVHTVTTATQHTQSHQRIRYGETVTVCENAAGWESANLKDRKAGEQFKANGETWVHKGLTSDPWNNNPASGGGHKTIALQRVIKSTYTTTYTTYNTETFGLSGAIYGETFLNSQMMVATSIDLRFTKVGETGDVTLCICEVDPSGAPDYQAVIARVTKSRSQLVNGWTKFQFEPTLLSQGHRYAWFVVTTGNHQLMTNSGNAFPGGSLFMSSDGSWSQGSATEDFTFRLNAARFLSSRTVVPFESLTLDGGMTEIEMVYQAWEPAATKLVWEIKAQGDSKWVPMDAREDNPLANLPPLVEIRAVFVGTEDVAPSINLTPNSRAITGRMRPDMRAYTDLIPFGFTTTEAQIVVNMDAYEPARHSTDLKLVLANGTVVNPAATRSEQDPSKPSRWKFTADFTGLPASTGSARVRIDATTNSVIHVPFGQDVQLNAF